jgi:CRISPR-associated exonuclease Cas4
MRQHYAVPVWSAQIGLYGRCDVVEIGLSLAVPIEHKIGAYRPGGPADMQVIGQVLCLREMLGIEVPYGEVFTHADRRRHRVDVTDDLVTVVNDMTRAIRRLLTARRLPGPLADRRCRRCSLLDDCLPHALTMSPTDLFVPRPLGQWNG